MNFYGKVTLVSKTLFYEKLTFNSLYTVKIPKILCYRYYVKFVLRKYPKACVIDTGGMYRLYKEIILKYMDFFTK